MLRGDWYRVVKYCTYVDELFTYAPREIRGIKVR